MPHAVACKVHVPKGGGGGGGVVVLVVDGVFLEQEEGEKEGAVMAVVESTRKPA